MQSIQFLAHILPGLFVLIQGDINGDNALFIDPAGSFDIRDLARFFPLIEEYDAVLGYRSPRRGAGLSRLRALAWRHLIHFCFGLNLRDGECAVKLFHTRGLQQCQLEARGAMLNTEILFKLVRAGYTYTEIPVRHLAPGHKHAPQARPLRTLYELLNCTTLWYRER